MPITIGSNISSLRIQRALSSTQRDLSSVFERLSSGQRINRASDDAAGLSIASSLGADVRVYNQGVRNLNDGISALNIASGALGQLSGLATRLKELSTQSANGVFSRTQRISLDNEAKALTDEFNRIVSSTSFNGRQLLDASLSTLRIQAGYGVNGSINFGLGQELDRAVGTGSYQAGVTVSSAAIGLHSMSADLNNDGNLDFIMVGIGGGIVKLGNGDGTFGSDITFTPGGFPFFESATLADFNGDGVLDIAALETVNQKVYVSLGAGDGTFGTSVSYAAGTSALSNGPELKAGDVNGDGISDLVISNGGVDQINVLIGSGTGTFQQGVSFASGDANTKLSLADINGDSILDIIAISTGDSRINVHLGNGDGTFGARISTSISSSHTGGLAVGDLNHDGIPDVVVQGTGVGVLIGNGDGTFATEVNYSGGASSGYAGTLQLGDANGDGILDIFALSASGTPAGTDLFLGNGDGTFQSRLTVPADNNVTSGTIGDFNNDGVLDIIGQRDAGNFLISLAQTEQVTTIGRLNLTTQEEALNSLSTIDAILLRINNEQGNIGSSQSRLSIALNAIQSTSDNYQAARNRIVDIDVAEDSAELVRLQVLQKSITAVLAQANLVPSLALQLLEQ